jgi:hypothetical protein
VKYLLDKVWVVSDENKDNTILQLGADISDTLEKEYVLSIPSDNEKVVFRVRAAVSEDKKNAAYGLMSGVVTEYGRILGEQNAHQPIGFKSVYEQYMSQNRNILLDLLITFQGNLDTSYFTISY